MTDERIGGGSFENTHTDTSVFCDAPHELQRNPLHVVAWNQANLGSVPSEWPMRLLDELDSN